ncbi:hypothetical protein DM01DRAFT_1371689 [Hesseltinella vesiculosa]|uniref:Uncharacterized protein n=1 Tax=Hesseltinella vesiculosa TaxID=101127 RepID=A0A1X2GPD4_9FUNG|nr:hypothetical protein DM01DRAFT_1371689 [Hesseltinella vesiculosa]
MSDSSLHQPGIPLSSHKIEARRILDSYYPAANTVALLVHNDFYDELKHPCQRMHKDCLFFEDFYPYIYDTSIKSIL